MPCAIGCNAPPFLRAIEVVTFWSILKHRTTYPPQGLLVAEGAQWDAEYVVLGRTPLRARAPPPPFSCMWSPTDSKELAGGWGSHVGRSRKLISKAGVSPKPGAENIICAGRQTKTICAILPSNCEQGPCGSSYSGIKQGMNLRTLLCIRSSCEPLGCGLRIRDWSFPESLPTTTCLRS